MEKQERRSIEQSVGEALASGKMTGEPLRKVIALGVVGISEPLADAVFRLKYGNDAKSYKDVLHQVKGLARLLSTRNNWRLRRARLDEMAKGVLDYWLSDTCPACEGRGWEKPIGAPYLSDNPCQVCIGRPGKRPYPWKLERPRVKIRERSTKERRRELLKRRFKIEWMMDRYKELLCELEAAERHIGEKIISVLASDVRSMTRQVDEAAAA